jgi:hypothetical protein
MKKPKRFSYVPKRGDFKSVAQYEAFVSALHRLETDGDILPLAETLQGEECLPLVAQNAIGELLAGALIGGEIRESRYDAGTRKLAVPVSPSWGYAVKVSKQEYECDPQRHERQETLAKEVHALMLQGVKRSDAKKQVCKERGVGTATMDAAVRAYEQAHAPMGRDARGRKPSN